jgi:uncharacterized protein (DUF2126 family)
MLNEPSDPMERTAREITRRFRRGRIALTLGGEPTYVPVNPEGPEWNVTAVGPTKLQYAREMAAALIADAIPSAVSFLSPGKIYPGEINPRWALHLVWRKDGTPLVPHGTLTTAARPNATRLAAFRKALLRRLKLREGWIAAADPRGRRVHVLPIDHPGTRWKTVRWPKKPHEFPLFAGDGPAGLRLPLHLFPENASRRALVIESDGEKLDVFLPPLLQEPFVELLEHVDHSLASAGLVASQFQGYLPHDEQEAWSILTLTADPGVLEINIPACATWQEYDRWIHALDAAAGRAGLRSWKETPSGAIGTGGGNHLLLGGPTLEANPFFRRPALVTSILRYWQHHPALSYLFTGNYVGPSSQAPRPDESTRSLYDLEMAYRFLESLPKGDHRQLISETLRHLHTDTSGNTHRSEVSFDKFWNAAWPGGCRGLIEFRAVETLPRPQWMSAVALLWLAIVAMLAERKFTEPLIEYGDQLHDRFFLPALLWDDFLGITRELKSAGYDLPETVFRSILNWRFPILLDHRDKAGGLNVRRAHEGWPLLSETPLEGGATSRFVDTSIERLELSTTAAWLAKNRVSVQGRELAFSNAGGQRRICGLRYRKSALHPSLHPGIPPHLPLVLTIRNGRRNVSYELTGESKQFAPTDHTPPAASPCRKLKNNLVTFDLRID